MKPISVANKDLSLRRVTQMHKPGHKHSVEKRIEVVTKCLALGNMRLVSELTGVSYALLREWKGQSWWKDLEAEIRASRRSEVDTKLSRIVDKALVVIEDRLDNGDFVYNQKTGDVSRKPVSIKEARGAVNDLMQRQAVLVKQEQEEKVVSNQTTMNDQLALLAQQFAAFNTKRTIDVVATNVAPGETHALHEERETRLQAGERAVQQQAGASESPHGTQSSPSGNGESWESLEGGRERRGSQEAALEGWDECSDEFEDSEQDSEQELFEELERDPEEPTQ